MRFLYESVAVKRYYTAVLTEDAAIFGTGPLDFSEKVGRLRAKSKYPGSKILTQTAGTGLRKIE